MSRPCRTIKQLNARVSRSRRANHLVFVTEPLAVTQTQGEVGSCTVDRSAGLVGAVTRPRKNSSISGGMDVNRIVAPLLIFGSAPSTFP